MSNTAPTLGHNHRTSYVIGYITSLCLTLTAFILVQEHRAAFSYNTLVAVIIGLAITQLFVQLVFFLHLGAESKPRWNLYALLFAGLVVGIVVIGSLWIMNNLNYRMMSPHDTETFIMEDEGIKPTPESHHH